MSRLEPFKNLSISDAARQLSVHPFDLVRLLAANDALPSTLRIEPAQMSAIRELGGIEDWWSDAPDLPLDETRGDAILRALCSNLVERGVVGDHSTRLDNLLRGLNVADQSVARSWVQGLSAQGLMESHNTPVGVHVSLVEGKEYAVADLAQGGDISDNLRT